LLQPALLLAAEKDSGSSFFKRTRKAKIETIAAEQETQKILAAAEPAKEITAEEEEAAKAALPPPIPTEPHDIFLAKNSRPRNPLHIPSAPPAIPGAPKSAPKPPATPKTK